MNEAATAYVLLLDDDAVVFSAGAVERAIAVLDRDANVTAIAFAQGEADGSPWPERMQPGRGREPAYVPAFIGFAHLLRRDAFLRLGGYRESLVFYGEEKDFCVRALEAGQRVVYLPDAVVGHVPDPGGRSATRYVRFVIRNDCLYSLYNEPWPLVAVGLPIRLWRYRPDGRARRRARRPAVDPGRAPEVAARCPARPPRGVVGDDQGWRRRLARTATPYRLVAEDRRQEPVERVSTDAARDNRLLPPVSCLH